MNVSVSLTLSRTRAGRDTQHTELYQFDLPIAANQCVQLAKLQEKKKQQQQQAELSALCGPAPPASALLLLRWLVLMMAGFVVVVMGVCGCGKSTVAAALAHELECEWVDADAFHSSQNVSKMKSGTPLTDADRIPWLLSINKHMKRFGHCAVGSVGSDRFCICVCVLLCESGM